MRLKTQGTTQDAYLLPKEANSVRPKKNPGENGNSSFPSLLKATENVPHGRWWLEGFSSLKYPWVPCTPEIFCWSFAFPLFPTMVFPPSLFWSSQASCPSAKGVHEHFSSSHPIVHVPLYHMKKFFVVGNSPDHLSQPQPLLGLLCWDEAAFSQFFEKFHPVEWLCVDLVFCICCNFNSVLGILKLDLTSCGSRY